MLESIVKEFEGKITYMEYNVDNSPEETQHYKITSIPVVVVEKDGVVIERFQGLSSKLAYTNAINEALK